MVITIMGNDGEMMTWVVLIATTVATASALSKAASVIFEADSMLRQGHPMATGTALDMKRNKVMPKLWAPIWQLLIGEAILMLTYSSGVLDESGQGVLLPIIVFFMVIALILGVFFYLAGRDRPHAVDEIR